jgi:acid phosphatase
LLLRRLAVLLAVVAAGTMVVGVSGAAGKARHHHPRNERPLREIQHIVVIYEENHSFDNLYGGWEGVRGLRSADAAHTVQVAQTGPTTFTAPFECLYQDDVNLQAKSDANPDAPLSTTCNNITGGLFPSHFRNAPFTIDDYLQPGDHTCPRALEAFSFPNGIRKDQKRSDGSFVGLPGGCTRDIVHRFYEEQFQLNGGRQNRYVLGSDAAGLVMGVYDTRALPIYKYLHQNDHPGYAILDNFFQAAFGGSFLNHQFLIAAAPPTCTPSATVTCPSHAVLDANGFTTASSPPASNRPPGMGALYTSPGNPSGAALNNGAVTQACGLPSTIAGLACGDAVVNTTQPTDRPHGAFGARIPRQTNPTIGDRLNAKGVDWAWYAGGWSNADGDIGAPGWTNGTAPETDPATPTDCHDPDADPSVVTATGEHISQWPFCPNNLFQYHHQPFNYFEAFSRDTAAGQANRAAHLKDEQEFIQLAQSSNRRCNLKPVSFVKPIGQENEHPGYASEAGGSSHLVSLLEDIRNSSCRDNTMVIVTYDEFGGQWDHVPPPGQDHNRGPHDQWGPGTRIPALVIAPQLRDRFVVDHTQYDTTSILRTIEDRYGLPAVATRDAAVNSLASVFAGQRGRDHDHHRGRDHDHHHGHDHDRHHPPRRR